PPIQMIWLPWDKALVALTLLAWWLRRPKQPLVSLDITALAFCQRETHGERTPGCAGKTMRGPHDSATRVFASPVFRPPGFS
ncbi:hypothetical protein LJG46_32865, partial [Pseudomonas aeruginosa]|nr:hypothetical protein [Pseudomonas aeruginosa]